ncbi:hypothetical protein KKKH46_14250 [Helicobacter pylori]
MAHILVSGATSGFGLEIAKAFLQKKPCGFWHREAKREFTKIATRLP